MSEKTQLILGGNASGAKQAIQETSNGFSKLALSIASGIASYDLVAKAIKAVIDSTKSSLEYLAKIETASLGIAAAYMLNGKYVDELTGKTLAGSAALKAAQIDAKDMMNQLQLANMQTIATLDQLVRTYQETLPVAMSKGFNRQQAKDFTVAMVQAAGAIGLPLDQMGEETRSILTGAINPRTSRIATVLGLRNEDVEQYKNNAQGLFDFLMTKLEAYRIAGIESQQTWAGIMSNTKDISLQIGGQVFDPLFTAIKAELTDLTKDIVVIDEKTKTIKWSDDFTAGIQKTKGVIEEMITDFIRLNMLLDKIGGTMTIVGKQIFTSLGTREAALKAITGKGDKTVWDEWNKMFEDRYKAGDKKLQDMAMRSQGYKPISDVEVEKIAYSGGDKNVQYIEGYGYYRREESKKAKYTETHKTEEDIKKTHSALTQMEQYIKQYTKSLAELASEEYKIIDQKFSDEMKKQLDSFKETGEIGDIAEKMKSYSATMDTVWSKQKTALDTIYDSMSKLSREVDKEQRALAEKMKSESNEAFLKTLETKTKQDIKLWQNYYNTLKSMHSDAVEDMKKKTKELKTVEDDLRKLITDRTASIAKPTTTTPYLDYMQKKEEVEAMIARLGGLEGDAFIKEQERIKNIITQNFSNAVDVFSKEDVIGQGNKYLESLANMAAEKNIAQQAKYNDKIQNLANTMKVVNETIDSLNGNLIILNQGLTELALKQITLEAINNVSPVITEIKKDLAALGTISLSIDVQNLGKAAPFTGRQVITSQDSSANIAFSGNRASGIDQSGQAFEYELDANGNWVPVSRKKTAAISQSADPNAPFGTYGFAASGMPYVYQDGPVYVHEGERILTKSENRDYKRGGGSLTIQGGINITLPAGSQVSGGDIAREIDAQLADMWKTDRSRLKKEINS